MGLSIKEQREIIRAKKRNKSKKIQKKIDRYKLSAEKLRLNQLKLNSPNEKKFRYLLIEHGIKYIWQKPFSNLERYICVDFFLPEKNIVIEIDGEEHNNKVDYDLKRTLYLKNSHGIKKVIRITNNQIANNFNQIKDFVLAKLK